MVLGVWTESGVQNDDLFTSLKAKKKNKPPKGAQRKPSHDVGRQTALNIFRTLGQYLKSDRTLYGQKMQDARRAFGLVDEDGGGTLDAAELGKALKRLGFGLTPVQLKEVLGVVDADGSGEVEYTEFIKLLGMEHETELGAVSGVFMLQPLPLTTACKTDQLRGEQPSRTPRRRRDAMARWLRRNSRTDYRLGPRRSTAPRTPRSALCLSLLSLSLSLSRARARSFAVSPSRLLSVCFLSESSLS